MVFGPNSSQSLCFCYGKQWIQDPGSRIRFPGSWIQDPWCRILESGSWIQDPGSRILDPGSWIQDPWSSIMDPSSIAGPGGHPTQIGFHWESEGLLFEIGYHCGSEYVVHNSFNIWPSHTTTCHKGGSSEARNVGRISRSKHVTALVLVSFVSQGRNREGIWDAE